jgi:hypothetical protein
MSTEQKIAIEQEIENLKSNLKGDMLQDMEARDRIYNLEMQLKGVKPIESQFECFGCGS